MNPCPQDWFEYLEGVLDAQQAAMLKAHLDSCPSCQERLEKDRKLLESLRACRPELSAKDLLPEVRKRLQTAPRFRPARLVWATPLAVLVLAVAFWFFRPSEIREKSSGDDFARWQGVTVWIISEDGEVKPLSGRVRADQFLAFSYTNKGENPYPYLMIFAVDSQGNVHWYFPAYLDEASDPGAISIRAGVEGEEIGEKIRLGLSPGRARLVALFSREIYHVKAIESAIASSIAEGKFWSEGKIEKLAFPHTVQQVIDLEVE